MTRGMLILLLSIMVDSLAVTWGQNRSQTAQPQTIFKLEERFTASSRWATLEQLLIRCICPKCFQHRRWYGRWTAFFTPFSRWHGGSGHRCNGEDMARRGLYSSFSLRGNLEEHYVPRAGSKCSLYN